MAKPKQWTTMKIPPHVHEVAHGLLKLISSKGWQACGSKRNDPPTLGAIVEEGLELLKQSLR